MPRIANPRPGYCSACFAHKDQDFIDFEAAYDGPTIPGTPTDENGMTIVADLILCEDCVREGAALCDFEDRTKTIAELADRVAQLEEMLVSKDKVIRGAESTISELVKFPVATSPGKPALVGLDDATRAAITRARYERNGTSARPKTRNGVPIEEVAA